MFFLGQKRFGHKNCRQKKILVINNLLKLCWVVVSIAGWCCITNFRLLGPFLLVELEFLGGGGWWGVCKVIIVSNPTRLRLGSGWVVVRLGFWQNWFYSKMGFYWKSPWLQSNNQERVFARRRSTILYDSESNTLNRRQEILDIYLWPNTYTYQN